MKLIAIVLILAALVYILYLWSKRKDQISCPSCGARVNIYAEECPHCGHEKGEPVESGEEAAAGVAAPAESTSSEPDVDYEAVVQETIPKVKKQVMENDLDPAKVMEAETANKDRVTLKDWLEGQIAEQ
jgi:uncharacterized Zn finger protein (UPF0148 family)